VGRLGRVGSSSSPAGVAPLRGALNLGWTVDELREALLQISGYAGFSAVHEALDVLSEIVT
jgi:alkylhydroperoxidase/carboxymuconolactone decarboxylase family protein YurZ